MANQSCLREGRIKVYKKPFLFNAYWTDRFATRSRNNHSIELFKSEDDVDPTQRLLIKYVRQFCVFFPIKTNCIPELESANPWFLPPSEEKQILIGLANSPKSKKLTFLAVSAESELWKWFVPEEKWEEVFNKIVTAKGTDEPIKLDIANAPPVPCTPSKKEVELNASYRRRRLTEPSAVIVEMGHGSIHLNAQSSLESQQSQSSSTNSNGPPPPNQLKLEPGQPSGKLTSSSLKQPRIEPEQSSGSDSSNSSVFKPDEEYSLEEMRIAALPKHRRKSTTNSTPKQQIKTEAVLFKLMKFNQSFNASDRSAQSSIQDVRGRLLTNSTTTECYSEPSTSSTAPIRSRTSLNRIQEVYENQTKDGLESPGSTDSEKTITPGNKFNYTRKPYY
ncbi:hypothetical protein M3Y97_01053900 [Aphelenchoides bicaudatus]|nr:hypothetical protein M3Y97_01053900 [Aphelenchoides bicaudatus]